jgi:hypothetical protein
MQRAVGGVDRELHQSRQILRVLQLWRNCFTNVFISSIVNSFGAGILL